MERFPSQSPHVLRVFGIPEVDRALADWLDANELELVHPELLETGQSGGKLVSAFLRELDQEQTGGMRIIKLVAPSPDAQAEPRNHKAALRSRFPGNAAFVDRHLVGLAGRHWRLGEYWVMFQEPAGDGKDPTVTLAALGRSARLPGPAAQIVKGLLSGWNPGDPEIDQGLTAAAFVQELLGARCKDDSPLHTWVRSHFGDGVHDCVWFAAEGQGPVLPNPLALGGGSPLVRLPVKFAARGRGHGDLHPGNIMVPVRDDAPEDDYWLIDLSRFSEGALLARDPVHLLLCLIAGHYLPHLSEEARAELLGALTGTGAEPESRCDGLLIPQGLAELVVRVRTELTEWAATRRVTQAWRAQWFLALQACALMFTARERYPDRDRSWFFRLAAHACGAYVDLAGGERPGSPEVVIPDGPEGSALEETSRPGVAPSKASVVSQRTGPGAVAVSPPAATPDPTGGAGAVAEVLKEIWSTFDRPAQQVSSLAFSDLKPDVVLFVLRRAHKLRTDLTRAQMAALMWAPGGEGGLGRVRDLLHDVATAAKPLHQFLVNPVLRSQTLATRQNPRHQDLLADALRSLLDEVGGAIAAITRAS
ncbi:hypothetical protein GCM10009535_38420 [Streptomyces thermocarboxydovorans]|uniref:Aminoglycoside phosphotransferase domain-containing protein n=1 Tax=Streptomyces thermocarboxydovorans TaxID=59298 RepID=A0ABN1HK11_9ACTN